MHILLRMFPLHGKTTQDLNLEFVTIGSRENKVNGLLHPTGRRMDLNLAYEEGKEIMPRASSCFHLCESPETLPFTPSIYLKPSEGRKLQKRSIL
jgi:hypothetical protein